MSDYMHNSETDECVRDYELVPMFKEYLDEVHGMVIIGECKYSPSEVVAAVCPTDYRVMFSDWQDAMGWEECEHDGEHDEKDYCYVCEKVTTWNSAEHCRECDRVWGHNE